MSDISRDKIKSCSDLSIGTVCSFLNKKDTASFCVTSKKMIKKIQGNNLVWSNNAFRITTLDKIKFDTQIISRDQIFRLCIDVTTKDRQTNLLNFKNIEYLEVYDKSVPQILSDSEIKNCSQIFLKLKSFKCFHTQITKHTQVLLDHISIIPSMEKISISEFYFMTQDNKNKLLSNLSENTNLQVIEFKEGLSKDEFKILNTQQLKLVSLNNWTTDDCKTLNTLLSQKSNQLKSLRLASCDVTNDQMSEILTTFPFLTHVIIKKCPFLTSEFMRTTNTLEYLNIDAILPMNVKTQSFTHLFRDLESSGTNNRLKSLKLRVDNLDCSGKHKHSKISFPNLTVLRIQKTDCKNFTSIIFSKLESASFTQISHDCKTAEEFANVFNGNPLKNIHFRFSCIPKSDIDAIGNILRPSNIQIFNNTNNIRWIWKYI